MRTNLSNQILDGILMVAVIGGTLLLCGLGLFAAIVRWHALDEWCEKQLEDSNL